MKGDKECEEHHCEYLKWCKWHPEECIGKPWEEDGFLELVIDFYGRVFATKEEMFLVGYLMGQGGESHLLSLIKHDLLLLERDARFFLPIVASEMRVYRKVHETNVEGAKKLLVKFLERRNAPIPGWLKAKTVDKCPYCGSDDVSPKTTVSIGGQHRTVKQCYTCFRIWDVG